MTDDEQREMAAAERYQAAAHAMQSGVAAEMNYRSEPTDPKHLRTGVGAAMVDHSALVTLLIKNGIISKASYFEALADAMEEEKQRYEKHLTELLGKSVTLA